MESTSLPLEEILNSLGLHPYDKGDYFAFSSPWRADKNPSCVCYKATGYTIDFGGIFKGSIKSLVYEVTGQSFGKMFPELGQTILHWNVKTSKTVAKEVEQKKREVVIKGRVDSVYDVPDALRYCYSRHITDEMIKEFQIKYLNFGMVNDGKEPWTRRLLIPIVEGGEMWSVEGRDITRKQTKKALYPKGGTTSTLFNIDRLDRKKPLVVVEGIMDLMPVWQVYKNVTATFGIQLTGRQQLLLKQFTDVILLPDSDEGGERFIDILDSFFEHEFRVARVPEKDPGESTADHIIDAIEQSIPVTRYLLEKTGNLQPRQRLLW